MSDDHRCPWAIKAGTTLNTRCVLAAGHNGPHLGRGLAEFDYQRIKWFAGDRREYQTSRGDAYAWETSND